VYDATSVKEAKKILKTTKIDVIISDYQMPVKNGLDFLKELRESEVNIPFILFTGRGREEVAIEALNIGASGYINKFGKPATVYGQLVHGIISSVKAKHVKDDLIKFKTISDRANYGVMLIDLDGNMLYVNEALAKIHGYTENELVGKNHSILHTKDEYMRVERSRQELFEKGHLVMEENHLKKDGSVIPVLSNVTVIKDQKWYPSFVAVIITDITERKKAENKIKKEVQLRATLLDNLPYIAIILKKGTREIVASNKYAREIGAFPGETCYVAFAKRADPCPFCLAPKLWATNERQSLEVEYRGKWYRVIWVPYTDDLYVHYVFDITERKKAEEELKESEKKLLESQKMAHIGNWWWDVKTGEVKWSEEVYKIFKRDPKKFTPKIDSIMELSAQWPEDNKRNEELIQKATKNHNQGSYEQRFLRPDKSIGYYFSTFQGKYDKHGKLIAIIGTVQDITERKKAEEKIQSLAKFPSENLNPVLRINKNGKLLFSNKAAKIIISESKQTKKQRTLKILKQSAIDSLHSGLPKEVEVKHKDKIFSFVFVPIIDNEYCNIYGRDITERKKTEKTLNGTVNEVSLVNDKLSVVGKLTRHDVRNKLSVVAGNLYILKEKLPPDHEVMKYLKKTESAFEQINRIFDRARTYERLGVDKLSYINVKRSCDEALSLIHDLGSVEVVKDCKGLTVYADSLLGQLFYNLIENSIKHGKKVSKITIYCKESKDRLKLIYEDDGVGIAKADKKKIFKEGYGKGIGMGLRMIKILCKIYGWTIQETGKKGKGAQFTITIPQKTKTGKKAYILSGEKK